MKPSHPRRLGRAFNLGLAAGAVAPFLVLPAVFAQDAPPPPPSLPAPSSLPAVPAEASAADEATELAPMLVTGSWIPQLDTFIASPVEVVGARRIERIGAVDPLEALRRTTPVFLGNLNRGQEVNNNGQGEAYIGLRNLPTVVLLNGRRLAGSGFSNGGAVDVNTIPVAAIERIEVFKDGASAIYGADAIGGVVNIITKKNFQGVEVKGRYGTTTRSDDYYEYMVSAVGGISSDKGSITAGASYFYSRPLLSSDRKVASLGLQDLGELGLWPPSYFSPTFSGRIDDYVLAGSEFAVGHPGYNPAMTTIPAQFLQPGRSWTPADLAAAGVLVPLSETPAGMQAGAPYNMMNTALLGTHTIQSQDRRQFFANFEHDLIGDRLQFFGDFLYSDTVSEGVLAPSPAPALSLFNITIPADNPYNPFGIALGANGAASPRIRNRLSELGNRISRYDSTYYHFVGGLRGRLDLETEAIEDAQWRSGFNYNKSDQLNRNFNAGTAAALNLALTPDFGASPDGRLSALVDGRGPVPTYDYFGLPGSNDPRTLQALRTTLFSKADSELYSFDASISARMLELPAGKVGWAVGGEYRDESLELSNDYLTETGQGIGYLGGGGFPGGSRDAQALFVEASIPVFSPDWNLPGVHALEISAAGRFEKLSPGGTASVPRVGVKWKPVEDDQVTLRATYSEGFIAPTIYEVFGPAADNAPYVLLPNDVNDPTRTAAQQAFRQLSSPDMRPSKSTSWTGGVALNPKALPGLLVTVDYYTVEQSDLYSYDWQGYVDSLNTLGVASPFYGSYEDFGGNRITGPGQVTHATFGLGEIERIPGAQKTHGIDLAAQYLWRTDVAGDFNFYANANVVLGYEFQSGGRYHSFEGLYTENIFGEQGSIPDYTVVAGVTWEYKDLSFNVNSRYVPGMDDLGFRHPIVGDSIHGNTVNDEPWSIDSWFAIDLQLAYEFARSRQHTSWYHGFRVAVGVQNVTDEDAPVVASSGEDNTDKSTYSILGRLVYAEISKKF